MELRLMQACSQAAILTKDSSRPMMPYPITSPDPPEAPVSAASAPSVKECHSFDMALEAAAQEYRSQQPGTGTQKTESLEDMLSKFPALSSAQLLETPHSSGPDIAAVCPIDADRPAESAQMSGFQKYRDDQLLRNPGGRNYYLDEKKVVENSAGLSVKNIIGKDFSDAFRNIKRFFGNMFLGTPILYRDETNEIRQGQQRGLLGTISDFCTDLLSALSFGAWHSKSTEAPHGFKDRLLYSVSKLKDAIFGDVLTGVPSSVNHMGQNLILSGWHLAEVLPDTASWNFEPARKLTTTIFDNGHVAIEYLTDIIPSGDAWLRVHASNWSELKPPVLYNLKAPENFKGDLRWAHVRNTPFRKTIETIGSLLTDALAIALIKQTGSSSNRRNETEF